MLKRLGTKAGLCYSCSSTRLLFSGGESSAFDCCWSLGFVMFVAESSLLALFLNFIILGPAREGFYSSFFYSSFSEFILSPSYLMLLSVSSPIEMLFGFCLSADNRFFFKLKGFFLSSSCCFATSCCLRAASFCSC